MRCLSLRHSVDKIRFDVVGGGGETRVPEIESLQSFQVVFDARICLAKDILYPIQSQDTFFRGAPQAAFLSSLGIPPRTGRSFELNTNLRAEIQN